MAEGEVGVTTPVEAPVAAPVEATPTPDTTADQVGTPQGEQPEAKPERTFTQKELDEIVQKRLAKESRRAERLGEERARREAAERELERLRAERNPRSQGDDPEPKEEDFAGKPYREFVDARSRWIFRQEQKAAREAQAREGQQHQQIQHAQQQAQYVHETLIAKGQEAHDDFDDVVLADHVPITPAMVAAAANLENGPEVLYQLAKNESELRRIAKLSDVKQAWELRDFSQKLKAGPKPTDAPPPIKPNSTKASVESGYRPDMSDKEYAEMRRRQIAQRR